MKRGIIVTGAGGFVGRNLMPHLRNLGFLAEAWHGNLLYSDEMMSKTPDTSFSMDQDWKAEAVVHLAARCGGIGANRAAPADFWNENLLMSANIIEWCSTFKIPLIFVGTTCSYPKYTPIPFRESEMWKGYPEETNAPYGLAKRVALVGLDAYQQQYGLKYTALIPANMYGPYDHFDLEKSHVIPAMIRKFMDAKKTGQPPTLWGDGTPTRDFFYVKNFCEVVGRILLTGLWTNDFMNVGAGREISISETAKTIADAVGYTGPILWDHTKPNGQPRRCLDISKSIDRIGWDYNFVSFEQGIVDTVQWTKENWNKLQA